MRLPVSLLALLLMSALAGSASAEIKGVTIRGSGSPVPNASVRLVSLDPLKGISLLGTAISGSQGEFRIELPESQPSAGRLMYLIASVGDGIGIEPVLNPRAVRRVELRRGLKVSGTVLNSEGRPVEAAKVKPVRLGQDRFFGRQNLGAEIVGFAAVDSEVTDNAGLFSYGPLPAGWELELEISKPGCAPVRSRPIPVGSSARITLETQAKSNSGRISGRVAEKSTGNPVPDIQVTAGTESGKAFHVATADDGGFVFEDLPVGEYALWVMQAEKPVEPEVGIEVKEGSATEVNLFAVEGTLVSGRVINQEGEGIPGISVVMPGSLPSVTGSDGSFSIRALPGPGVVTIDGADKGYAPLIHELAVPDTGEVVGLELRITPASVISGRVLDPSGRGVNGALVRLISPDGPIDLTEADSDGHFEFMLEGTTEDEYYLIACDPVIGNGVVARHESSRDEPADLQLLFAASLTGILKGSDGRPVRNAEILPMMQVSRFRILSTHNKASTDSAGRFEIRGLIPEVEYVLSIDLGDGSRHFEKLPQLASGEQASAEFILP